MRILAGHAKGVPLKTVPDPYTRPILDRLKKSLFSILDSSGLLDGTRVADLYAGAGTLGLEALSRGAQGCLFVELRGKAIQLLRENLARTKLEAKAEIRQGEVFRVLKYLTCQKKANPASIPPFDLILFDPPFAQSREENARKSMEVEMALGGELLSAEGCLVLRTEKKSVPPQPSGLVFFRHWTDGPHAFCFYRPGSGTLLQGTSCLPPP